MRFLRLMAMVGALVAGALGLSAGRADASPLAAAAMTSGATPASDTLVSKAYHFGRPHYVERRFYRRGPVYAYPPVYRMRRPYPRVVCRTRVRYVRVAGGWVRRPVRICTRRW